MAHCTRCGSALRETDRFCGECGSPRIGENVIPPVNDGKGSDHRSVATLMGMAKTAEMGSNNAEALEYYNRVLEMDPTIVDAWLGKGRSAAWQSTLANLRVSEGVIAFKHAISNAGDDRQPVIKTAIEELNKIVSALYRLARSHMEDFSSLDQTWRSYLSQVAQMIEALEEARSWSPQDRSTLENIIHLAKDNIEGYKYWDNINRCSGLHSITPEYEAILRNLMDNAVNSLREADETYVAPTVQKKQAGACFVVTASMGNASHPDVILLRKFRDEWILRKPGGRIFVSWYYNFGPLLAGQIERGSLRRRLARLFIVRPAAALAVKLLARTRYS